MNKSMVFFTMVIFSLVVLTSCQKDQLEIGDQISQIDVAKKGVTDPSIFDPGDLLILEAKKGGSKPHGDGEYNVTVAGDLSSNGENYPAQDGYWKTKGVRSLDGLFIDLGPEYFNDLFPTIDPPCFPAATTPIVTTRIRFIIEQSDGSARVLYAFKAFGTDGTTEILYHLRMYGTFDDPDQWRPLSGETVDVTLTDYELTTQKKPDGNRACTTSGSFQTNVTFTVERTN